MKHVNCCIFCAILFAMVLGPSSLYCRGADNVEELKQKLKALELENKQLNEALGECDGEIYFELEEREVETLPEDVEFFGDESHPYVLEKEVRGEKSVLYQRRLARWKDLTTPPKTKAVCIKMCHVGPIRTCCQWRVYKRWLYKTATLRVTTSVPLDVGSAVERCLKKAAVAAAVAAIVSGGTAAAAVAEKAFEICLVSELGSELVGVNIIITQVWGDWSPV